MEEAERLCDRIAIVDHGRIIALDSKEALVHSSFGSRSQVVARLEGSAGKVGEWVAARGGRLADSTAEFTIEHPAEIAVLLDGATAAGLELVDLSLRRPNLESVFLHLTGRELRD
jgi:ABC-2 type transport system ATP-binding protein